MRIDRLHITAEILNRLMGCLLLTEDGSIMDANPAALVSYGYPLDAIAAMTLRDLDLALDETVLTTHLAAAAQSGGILRTRHRRSDGSSFPVQIVSVPVVAGDRDALLSVVHDLSELQASEDALLASQDLLRAIIDNSALLVWVKDLDGRVTLANRRLRSVFSDLETDLIGKTSHEVLPKDQADAHTANDMEVIEARTPLVFEEQVSAPDGEQAYLSTKFPIFDAHGDVSGIAGVSVDITELRHTERQLLDSNVRLERMVRGITEAMGRAVEARDPYTQGHEIRVAALAVALAEEMGVPPYEITGIEIAALLHDIGKMAVPVELLTKPGSLTDEEHALVRCHPRAGYDILKGIDFPWPVAESILQHHERMDGSGYPEGLRADDICMTARILGVADVVEAMSSHRPYRPSLGIDTAMTEILSHRERYDPDVLAACERLHESGRIDL